MKTILIAGGTSGIGLETVKLLSKNNDSVINIGIEKKKYRGFT